MRPKSNSGPNKIDRIQEIIRLEGRMGENMARLTVESIRVFTHMNPKLFALISSLVALAVCAKAEDVVVQKETETKKEHVVSKHPQKKQDVEIQETEKVKK